MNYAKRTVLYDNITACRSTEYSSWANMQSRCKKAYKESEYYRENGITVCESWSGQNGFLNFFKDMGRKPSTEHTLDRIDGTKGYSKENCRWATKRQQAINRKMYKTNSSGYRGVIWYKSTNRWRAYIDRKTIGYFKDKEQAALAYDVEAIKRHGEDAHTNLLEVSHAI